MTTRLCSRVTCRQYAVSTLTFDYSQSTAVLGPLSFTRDPQGYDLCGEHAERTSAPLGWQIIRHTAPAA